MSKRSAGLLLYRQRTDCEVLLVHPGGPFWARRDAGAWSIPKGEYDDAEEALAAARRECVEELGPAATPLLALPDAAFSTLGDIRQRAGKVVTAFAAECDIDVAAVESNTIAIVWPPRSGRTMTIPEIDRAEWFSLAHARDKIIPAQAELLDRLRDHLETI